jgi:hypothetical protein
MGSTINTIKSPEKNYLINGNMDYAQRAANSSGTSGYISLDRWKFESTMGGTVNIYRDDTSVPNLNSKYCMTVSPTATATPTGSQHTNISQRVEDIFANDFRGKDLTFGGWVRTNFAGNYNFFTYLGNGANYSSWQENIYIPAGVWTYVTIKMPSAPITFDTDSNIGAYCGINLDSGDTTEPPSGWQTNAVYRGGPSQAHFMSNTSNWMQMSQFQLLAENKTLDGSTYNYAGGNVITELNLCQRYYEKSWDVDIPPSTATVTSEQSHIMVTTGLEWDANNLHTGEFEVEKRSNPVFTTYTSGGVGTSILWTRNGGGQGIGNHGGVTTNTRRYRMSGSYAGSGSSLDIIYVQYAWTADAEL